MWVWMWRIEGIWVSQKKEFLWFMLGHRMLFWHWYQRTNCNKDRICVRHVGFYLMSSERDWRIIPGLTWISHNYASKIGCFWNWFSIASSCGILYKRFWTPGFCYHDLVTPRDEDVCRIHFRECKFSDRQSSQIVLFTSPEVSFFLISR